MGMDSMRGRPAVIALVVLAAVFLLLAFLYGVGALQVFTSTGSGPHRTHAILFGVLFVAALIGANFARRREIP